MSGRVEAINVKVGEHHCPGLQPLELLNRAVPQLPRQGRQLVNAGHDTDCHTAGIDQVDRHAAQ